MLFGGTPEDSCPDRSVYKRTTGDNSSWTVTNLQQVYQKQALRLNIALLHSNLLLFPLSLHLALEVNMDPLFRDSETPLLNKVPSDPWFPSIFTT